jgi:hypothetical protein
MRLLFFKLTILYKALLSLQDQVVSHRLVWVPLVAHPSRLQGWVPLPLDSKAVRRNLWSEVLVE